MSRSREVAMMICRARARAEISQADRLDIRVAPDAQWPARTGRRHAAESRAKNWLAGSWQAKIEALVLVVRPFGPIFRLA